MTLDDSFFPITKESDGRGSISSRKDTKTRYELSPEKLGVIFLIDTSSK
jgi:hypothetical protein